jgi:hypothetical protein
VVEKKNTATTAAQKALGEFDPDWAPVSGSLSNQNSQIVKKEKRGGAQSGSDSPKAF